MQFLVAAVALLMGIGCEPGTREDAAGTWGPVELVEELSIGVAEGSPELMFGRIAQIAVGPEGEIYVGNQQPVIVRAFDRHGRYLGEVGREGEGPGEYRDVAGLAVLPDGRVAVWSWGTRRVTVYGSDGEVDWSAEAQSPFLHDTLVVDRDGSAYVMAASVGGPDGEPQRRFLRKFTPAGEPAGELELPVEDPPIAGYGILDMIRGEISNFEAGGIQAFSPLGYVVTGPNDRYAVEVRAPGGTVVLERDVERAPILPDEREEIERWVEYAIEQMRQMGREVETVPLPERKPFFREIRVGDDGRIWLQRYATAERTEPAEPLRPDGPPPRLWREPEEYDVFEPDGEFLGTVRLPLGVKALRMRGDRIWGTRMDQAGVERVVRLRVEPSG